jgi:hypothetical protein
MGSGMESGRGSGTDSGTGIGMDSGMDSEVGSGMDSDSGSTRRYNPRDDPCIRDRAIGQSVHRRERNAMTNTQDGIQRTKKHWSRGFAETSWAFDGRLPWRMHPYNTFSDWWRGSKRGDDMIWVVSDIGYDNKIVLLRLAVRLIRGTRINGKTVLDDIWWEDTILQAVDVAERYANGMATQAEMDKARNDMSGGLRTCDWGSCGEEAFNVVYNTVGDERWCKIWNTVWHAIHGQAHFTLYGLVSLAGGTYMRDLEELQARYAAMIREVVPLSEIEPLVNRYIEPAL